MSANLLVIDRAREPRSERPGSDPAMAAQSLAAQSLAARRPGAPSSVAGAAMAVSSARAASSAALADWIQLTKPRIVVMVLVTAAVAALVAGGRALSPLVLLHTLLGTGLVGASAGAINQVWERRIDRLMKRTCRRPLPDGRIGVIPASCFGIAIGLLGTAYLWITVGTLPAALGLATWVTYVLVYTPMKTRTSWNTTVGAISGALPMMMGYTAAGGQLTEVRGWLLVGVLMLWQYPHFMAIAWMYRREYGAAGFQMTPVVEPTGRSAGRQAVGGAVALAAVLVALVAPAPGGWLLAAAMLAVSWGLLKAAVRFARAPDDASARRLMRSSLLQLPAAMLVLVVAALLA